MAADNAAPDEQDAMAAEWAAALAEAQPATEVQAPAEQVAPASFTNFAPTAATTARAVDSATLDARIITMRASRSAVG